MTTATPRPAASLILLRHGGGHGERGIEVLLVRRSPESSFMPGVWVFPGGVVEPDDVAAQAQGGTTDAERQDLAHRACAARELGEEAGIELPADADLRPWSRWITPEGAPVRFDTRFYVTLAPPHSRARPDGAETTEATWISPAEALERHRGDDLPLVFPTIKHLESLMPYSSSDEVLTAARDRRIEPVVPRVVREGEALRVLLPGEPGY
jgi:8-oxo-dGTP pyrophosphatase MutT (NUDIX family)